MSKSLRVQSRYIPGLDGLRALAVLAVIAYHLRPDLAPGGLLGVTVFFVLSGYLITNLLLIEWDTTNKIDLKKFWYRRAKRLLPAMFTMLIAITAWVTLFDHSYLPKLKEDFVAAALYVSNWWYIYQDLSYFETMETPSLLTHFWSLAVEEQFYIFWPLLIWAALATKLGKKRITLMVFLLALLSALLMAMQYEPGTDPSRVYYGTDTRVFSLLFGAILAFFWPSHKLSKRLPNKVRFTMDLTGFLSLVLLVAMMATVNEYDSFLYLGGMVILSILSTVVIAVIVHPSSQLTKWLSFLPLRWIGTRSYGIYLWQYPIIILTTPQVNTSGFDTGRTILQLALILIISELSYRFIEDPIRKGTFLAVLKGNGKRTMSPAKFAAILGGAVIVFISTIGLAAPQNDTVVKTAGESEAKKEEIVIKKKETENSNAAAQPKEETGENTAEQQPAPDQKEDTGQEDAAVSINETVTVIGDSVMVDVAPILKQQFPNITIDAKVGRQMNDAGSIIDSFKNKGELGERIIIALGSNGSFNDKQLAQIITSLNSNKKIYLVNVRVPRPWESAVNDELAKIAARFRNIQVIDWYKASTNHDEYFANDGVHLTKKGAEAYANLLFDSMK